MILKIIGSAIVILASSYIGFAFSKDCSRRPQELRDLQAMLQIFENEISYLSNLLTDAFEKVYKSSNSTVSVFFEKTVEFLREGNMNASQAWEKAVRNKIGTTALKNEDEEILVSFGKMLGNSDLAGQIKNIQLTMYQIKLQEQKAEALRKKYETMYKTLGVLGGTALVIMLV